MRWVSSVAVVYGCHPGSLLCGFAWNLPSLIFFRLLQDIGGGILLPMVMTLLYDAFPAEKRGMATGVMGIPLMIAPTFGPVLGGYFYQCAFKGEGYKACC